MKTLQVFIFGLIIMTVSHSNVNAQIKIHDDNHVSIGSLNKSFGIQMQPSGYTYFNPSLYSQYAWLTRTYAHHLEAAAWIVSYYDDISFFVFGNGDTYCRNLYESSDSTKKENIKTIENALELIKGLHGVTFNYKSDTLERSDTIIDHNGNIHIINSYINNNFDSTYIAPMVIDELRNEKNRRKFGLIAQEVEKTIPDLVRTRPDGSKALAYTSITGILVEAIKDQQLLIEDLYNQLNYIKGAYSPQINGNEGQLSDEHAGNSNKCKLYQNHPNPYSQSTVIKFFIDNPSSQTSIFVFNMQGVLIKSYENLSPETGQITILGNEFSPGMYFYSLIVNGNEIDTKRMILTL